MELKFDMKRERMGDRERAPPQRIACWPEDRKAGQDQAGEFRSTSGVRE